MNTKLSLPLLNQLCYFLMMRNIQYAVYINVIHNRVRYLAEFKLVIFLLCLKIIKALDNSDIEASPPQHMSSTSAISVSSSNISPTLSRSLNYIELGLSQVQLTTNVICYLKVLIVRTLRLQTILLPLPLNYDSLRNSKVSSTGKRAGG